VPPEIQILNGSALRERALRGVAHTVQGIFSLPVSLERADLDLEVAFDHSRKQNNSTVLLAQILNKTRELSRKRLAVVDVDLFIPVLTFVFGEAQLRGPAAIVSTHRLSNSFYGLPRDDGLMLQRLEKEIIHELGHTFGLYHCHHFECVMRSSTYVEEIDMKRALPCAACAEALATCLK
jgi:archaemetzincin